MPKKLLWLEYTNCGPLIATLPFEASGFEVKDWEWHPDHPNELTDNVLPIIKSWRPDIIVFWLAAGYWNRVNRVKEPQEWLNFCEQIKELPETKNTQLMAYLGSSSPTLEDQQSWNHRYVFWTSKHLQVVKHAITAHQLVGNTIADYEGVKYYLLNCNGVWSMKDELLQFSSRHLTLSVAEGYFIKTPKTRTLENALSPQKFTWHKDSILPNISTKIIFLTSHLFYSDWYEYFMQIISQERSSQLLIGIPNIILENNIPLIQNLIKKLEGNGGKFFILEHMWFEIMPGSKFEDIVYKGNLFDHWIYPFII